MSAIVVNRAQVYTLLPMPDCVLAMERAFASLARGDAQLPLRPVVRLPDGVAAFAAMPAYLGDPRVLGVKAIAVFPGNAGTPHDSHQGAVLLFDPDHGSLVAIMDAGAITAVRTAAVSALATRLLARPDAGDLALIGSGVQARTHLEAMRLVRPVRRVRVWSRTRAHAAAFAQTASVPGLEIEVAESARAAVEGADLVCTVSAAREPVVRGEWLAPGAHVNAVGASTADARELDDVAVVRAACFVDRRESALREAGDLLAPLAAGIIVESHIRAELGELVTGRLAGRLAPQDITLFKSVGLAIEDLAAADVVLRRAAAVERITLD